MEAILQCQWKEDTRFNYFRQIVLTQSWTDSRADTWILLDVFNLAFFLFHLWRRLWCFVEELLLSDLAISLCSWSCDRPKGNSRAKLNVFENEVTIIVASRKWTVAVPTLNPMMFARVIWSTPKLTRLIKSLLLISKPYSCS